MNQFKVGDLYLCPKSWNGTIGRRETRHLIQITKSNPKGTSNTITVKVITKPLVQSKLRDPDSFILSEYSAASLVHINSIHRLIAGVYRP